MDYTVKKQTKIDIYDFGKYAYTCLYFLIDDIAAINATELQRPRVEALIEGLQVKGALIPDTIGSKQTAHLEEQGYKKGQKIWYLILSKKYLSAIDRQIGDGVAVELRLGDQDEVELSETLQEFLANNPDINRVWQDLTPGKKRSLAHRVNSAKSQETIEKRLLELQDTIDSL